MEAFSPTKAKMRPDSLLIFSYQTHGGGEYISSYFKKSIEKSTTIYLPTSNKKLQEN